MICGRKRPYWKSFGSHWEILDSITVHNWHNLAMSYFTFFQPFSIFLVDVLMLDQYIFQSCINFNFLPWMACNTLGSKRPTQKMWFLYHVGWASSPFLQLWGEWCRFKTQMSGYYSLYSNIWMSNTCFVFGNLVKIILQHTWTFGQFGETVNINLNTLQT